MQFPNDTASHFVLNFFRHSRVLIPPSIFDFTSNELRPERPILTAFAQSEQANQNVFFRIFIGEEGLPAAIRSIIAPKELNRCGPNFMVDLVYLKLFKMTRKMKIERKTYSDLTISYISTYCSKVLHPIQRQFSKVSRIFASTTDQRKGDVPGKPMNRQKSLR
jgi:hypothetical protein